MRKTLALAALVSVLAVTGCSGQSPEQQSLDLCVKSAEGQLGGVTIDRSALKATNMGDALFDAGITQTKNSDSSNALITVAGEFTWIEGTVTQRKSMVCTVKFNDGAPSVEASLS